MSGPNQRTQARVPKLARSAECYLAVSSAELAINAASENTQLQMRSFMSPNPLSDMTVAQPLSRPPRSQTFPTQTASSPLNEPGRNSLRKA